MKHIHTNFEVYKPKIVVIKHISDNRKRKGQIITHHHIDILKLEYVDVIVYDFLLTTRGTLDSRTTKIVKRAIAQEVVT